MVSGIFRSSNQSPVSAAEANDAWARAARVVLEDVAGEVGATITDRDLAQAVQDATGIETTQPIKTWIGKVLERVERASGPSDPAALTALVVQAAPPRPRSAAAASVPRPARAAPSGRSVPRAPAARPTKTLTPGPQPCPTCFVQLPASGVCPNCG